MQRAEPFVHQRAPRRPQQGRRASADPLTHATGQLRAGACASRPPRCTDSSRFGGPSRPGSVHGTSATSSRASATSLPRPSNRGKRVGILERHRRPGAHPQHATEPARGLRRAHQTSSSGITLPAPGPTEFRPTNAAASDDQSQARPRQQCVPGLGRGLDRPPGRARSSHGRRLVVVPLTPVPFQRPAGGLFQQVKIVRPSTRPGRADRSATAPAFTFDQRVEPRVHGEGHVLRPAADSSTRSIASTVSYLRWQSSRRTRRP